MTINVALRRARQAFYLVLVLGLVIGLAPLNLAFADTLDKLYVSPSNGQPYIGNTFPVSVGSYSDSDNTNGSVNGTVTYNPSLLKVVSTSVSGSGYNSPSVNPGNGTVTFSGTRSPAPSGIAQIFTINFQAVGAGSVTVGFSGDSRVNNSTTQYVPATFTVVNPNPTQPTQPSSPTTTPKTSSGKPVPSPTTIVTTPSNTSEEPVATIDDNSQPQPTPDPTGVIDSVNITSLYSSGSVTWKVNADNPTSAFTYGSNSSQLTKSGAVTKNPDGTFGTTLSDLTPGTRYYFSIEGTGSGDKTGTYSGTLMTQGFPVAMTITENNVAVTGGQVKIGTQSYSIGSGGKLTIGLASGSYSVTITTDTSTLTQNMTVAAKEVPNDGSAPASQSFAFNLTSSVLEQGPGSGFSILGFIGVLLGGTAILALGFVGFMAYRRRQFENGTSASSGSSVVIQDGYDWHQQDTVATPTSAAPADLPPVTSPNSASSQHFNSVHLSEEEPLDMFEQAANLPLPPAHTPSPDSTPPAAGQSPNLPHSTTT
jgi:hypothetical protein